VFVVSRTLAKESIISLGDSEKVSFGKPTSFEVQILTGNANVVEVQTHDARFKRLAMRSA
jgi:hypothetical protein